MCLVAGGWTWVRSRHCVRGRTPPRILKYSRIRRRRRRRRSAPGAFHDVYPSPSSCLLFSAFFSSFLLLASSYRPAQPKEGSVNLIRALWSLPRWRWPPATRIGARLGFPLVRLLVQPKRPLPFIRPTHRLPPLNFYWIRGLTIRAGHAEKESDRD